MSVSEPTDRDINQFFAEGHGFFWLPCKFPGCGRMFGGHEMGTYTIQDPDDPHMGWGTCRLHDKFAELMLFHKAIVAEYWSSDGKYHWKGIPADDIKWCRDRDIPLPDFERDVQI